MARIYQSDHGSDSIFVREITQEFGKTYGCREEKLVTEASYQDFRDNKLYGL